MLYTIIRGFAIGVLVSAPMGPIGVLCIQRTLNKGRWSGFVTGVGAAVSDLCYALLTGLGMSIVIEFVTDFGEFCFGGIWDLSLSAKSGKEYP